MFSLKNKYPSNQVKSTRDDYYDYYEILIANIGNEYFWLLYLCFFSEFRFSIFLFWKKYLLSFIKIKTLK